MSERPETEQDVDAAGHVLGTVVRPWGKELWGTEVTWPGGSKLEIDRQGNGVFTDGSGERGRWDPTMGGWVDPDTGELMHPQFGLPGWELSPKELRTVADQLAIEAEKATLGHRDDLAGRYRERSDALYDQAKNAEQ